MTLIRRLALGIVILLLLIFISTYLITMNNARNYFIKQLESNAQDTATSLGLSLSQSFRDRDMPTMLSMVKSVFDRGYYENIEIKDIKGNVLVSRLLKREKRVAPQWFINLIALPELTQRSIIMHGWKQAGKVSVTTDTDYAYEALWKSALSLSGWYLIFLLFSLVLAYLFIQTVLRPLGRVVKQAKAISNHSFPIVDKIPGSPEFKQLTNAMNQMVLKVKSMFEEQRAEAEKLRKQAYKDPLTGFNNRRLFTQEMSSLLYNEDDFIPGCILMISIDGLDKFNQNHGYEKGDNLILTTAKQCETYWQKSIDADLFRLDGSTFAILEHDCLNNNFQEKATAFYNIMQDIIKEKGECSVNMAAVIYQPQQTLSDIFRQFDELMAKGREKGKFLSNFEKGKETDERVIDLEDIVKALNDEKILLYWQPVTNGQTILHREIYVRLLADDKNELGAGFFMPVAERNNKAHIVDMYVLKQLHKLKPDLEENIALNLSINTIDNETNRNEYINLLKTMPDNIRKHLYLEFRESMVMEYFESLKSFIDSISSLGVKMGIDNAGRHLTTMENLNDLSINYIKLHGSLLQDIGENKTTQFFIHYFNKMASTLDIQVVATQIEQEQQWEILKNTQITWGQGKYLGDVEPMS